MPAAWSPTQRYLDRSRLRRFANANGLGTYDALLGWATDDLERFWRAVDRDLGLVWTAPYARAMDTSKGLPWTTWWTGGRMNYVATALRHDGDRVAIVAEGEEGTVRTLTYRELSDQVASFAAGLRSLGVKHGDRVAIFLPLTVECAVAVLAVEIGRASCRERV